MARQVGLGHCGRGIGRTCPPDPPRVGAFHPEAMPGRWGEVFLQAVGLLVSGRKIRQIGLEERRLFPARFGRAGAASRPESQRAPGRGGEPGGKTFMFRADKHQTGKVLDGQIYRAHPFGRSIPERKIVVPMSPEECLRLQTCEKTVREGLGMFVAVGAALMEIRDARLYRETHPSFESFIQSVFALSCRTTIKTDPQRQL